MDLGVEAKGDSGQLMPCTIDFIKAFNGHSGRAREVDDDPLRSSSEHLYKDG
jgi:hypothetical protein